MEASTIAIILLLGIPLLIGMIAIPELLMLITFLSLIFGFINILMIASWTGGWYLFLSLLWEFLWIAITFIPKQREIWSSPL